MTYFSQGPSFLNPQAYALLHQAHHKYSDTEKHFPMSLNFANKWFEWDPTYPLIWTMKKARLLKV